MVLNENDYPMSFKEFEQRVVELFLEDYDGNVDEIMDKIDEIIGEKPNFLDMLYGQSCFIYESPHIYGDNCKNIFEDVSLKGTPVAQLRMLVG